jgi:hypothetical protein
MHYGATAFARPQRYRFEEPLTRAAFYRSEALPGTAYFALFFDPETRQFERYRQDAQGRLILDAIDRGRLPGRFTDVLHWTNAGRTYELRFNRNNGRQQIVEIDNGGLPLDRQVDDRRIGNGTWAIPTMHTGPFGVAVVHFNRRTNVVRMMELDPNAGWVSDFDRVEMEVVTQDASQLINAPFGTDRRLIMFNGDGDRSITQFPMIGFSFGPAAGTATWPGRWEEAMVWQANVDGTTTNYIMGYERRGRVVRYDLDGGGGLTNEFAQTQLPRGAEYAGLCAQTPTRVDLYTINARGGIFERCRGWNMDRTLTIGDEHEVAEPTIEVLNDTTERIGSRDLSETDIVAVNLLCDRDRHVAILDEENPSISERVEIADLDVNFSRALPYALGPVRLMLLAAQNDPTVRLHMVGRNGNLHPPGANSTLTDPVREVATLTTPSGRFLYCLGNNGNVRRYGLGASIRNLGRGPELTNYRRFASMVAIPSGASGALLFYNWNDGSAIVHSVNNDGTITDSGTTFRLTERMGGLIAYEFNGTIWLLQTGDGRQPSIWEFDPTDFSIRREVVSGLGRNWTDAAVHPESATLVLYRWRNGRTEVWRLDADGVPEELVGEGEDRRNLTGIMFFDARDGRRYMTFRSPEFWNQDP